MKKLGYAFRDSYNEGEVLTVEPSDERSVIFRISDIETQRVVGIFIGQEDLAQLIDVLERLRAP